MFVCPAEHAVLEAVGQERLVCTTCGSTYRIEGGVARFMDHDDPFYEGAYQSQVRFNPKSERWWHVWPLWLINSGYLWQARRHVPRGSTAIELGCAGGVRYFGTRFRMIGCDVSFKSLLNLQGYQHRVQADATIALPLPDNAVDAVFSSYFWEHILPSAKPRLLEECRRVLRPGGVMVFLYDVETANPLIRRYRAAHPGLYDKLFLEGDGHVGYQTPTQNLDLFQRAGFRIEDHRGLEKTWLHHASVYSKLAAFPGAGAPLWKAMARLIGGPLFVPYTLLMRVVDSIVCRLLPVEWARIDLVVLRKSSE